MRPFLAGVLILAVTGIVAANDEADRELRAKAALALCAKQAAIASPVCKCPEGTRGTWQQQLPKAIRENRVLVLFSGGAEPRCCKGTLLATMPTLPVGQPKAKPIIVYAPTGDGRLQVIAELSGDATNVQLTAAVDKAKSFLSEKSK